MTLPSIPLVNGQPTSKQPATTARKSAWAVGFVALAFGVILWWFGAKYTLDGWVIGLNWFLGRATLPIVLRQPVGWWVLVAIPLALIYSRVEVNHRPVSKRGDRWVFAPAIFWVAWLLVVVTDVGSTLIGVKQPAGEWGVLQPMANQIATSYWYAGVTATILTFLPEWLILSGVWLLRR